MMILRLLYNVSLSNSSKYTLTECNLVFAQVIFFYRLAR